MIADRSIVFRGIESIVKWPFQNEDNFYSSAIATIALLASQRLFNVSYPFSLGFATTIFFATRVYQVFQVSNNEDYQIISTHEGLIIAKEGNPKADLQDLQKAVNKYWITKCIGIIMQAYEIDKKRKETLLLEKEENIEEMKKFLKKNLLYMRDVFRGYSLNEKEEKIETDKFAKENEEFTKLCEYFNLDIEVFRKAWFQWPGVPKQEFVLHCKNRAEFFFGNIQ
ncbi:MAG: hypothetical protein K940chlam5_00513 [Candidatus Anoxychlamydiales bacterium]|nr:hypothetical protein [Candidatus Anoxychlamydiales bacterium]